MPLRFYFPLLLLAVAPITRAANIPEAPIGRLAQQQPDDPERKEMVRVQVLLDHAEFRPGKIDGLAGEFTQKAADRYCIAHALTPGTRLDTSGIPEPYRSHIVTERDAMWIGLTATQPQEQAKLKRLPYTDMWEALAEKFHTDYLFIRELNPSFKEPPKVGDTVRVPDVEPFNMQAVVDLEKQRRAEARAKKEAAAATVTASPSPTAIASPSPTPPPEPKRRLVLLREPRVIELYEDDKLVGCFPCTPGSQEFPVPPGSYKIISNTLLPWYRWDKSVLETGKRSDISYNLPPGPNNPVGIVWLALNIPSRGVHGTPNPDQIGRNASHGCIRTANWDAWVLARKIKAGTLIEVR